MINYTEFDEFDLWFYRCHMSEAHRSFKMDFYGAMYGSAKCWKTLRDLFHAYCGGGEL